MKYIPAFTISSCLGVGNGLQYVHISSDKMMYNYLSWPTDIQLNATSVFKENIFVSRVHLKPI